MNKFRKLKTNKKSYKRILRKFRKLKTNKKSYKRIMRNKHLFGTFYMVNYCTKRYNLVLTTRIKSQISVIEYNKFKFKHKIYEF